jgi:uncharacterized protein YwgA
MKISSNQPLKNKWVKIQVSHGELIILMKIIYFALAEENRKQLYQSYYYGPYSADVQQTIFSLLRKESVKDIKQLRIDTESSLCRPEEDNIVKRLRLTADFFTQKGITTTGDISFLAKVHLLKNSKREEAKKTWQSTFKIRPDSWDGKSWPQPLWKKSKPISLWPKV